LTNSWTQSDAGISGFSIPVYTLTANPNISFAFMHLPDGNVDGSGFSSTGNVSLQDLWTGTISSMTTVDGSSTYTKDTLLSTLTKLMASFQPDRINTQDFVGTYGDGDHSDHHSVAYFMQTAAQNYTTTHILTGYLGYPVSLQSANITGPDLIAKQFAFYAYAQYDPNVCNNESSCGGSDYAVWLQRQYTVNSGAQEPVANAGADQTVGLSSTVQLDGTGSSDPNNATLTYQWTQIGGPTVTLSNVAAAQPTFTTPNSAATLVFQLVVNNGTVSSTPAMVTITTDLYPTNVALNATATASSENTSTGQTADKAIDGIIDGYPRDYTKEWATNSGGAGSWLMLTWNSPQTVDRIVLYDRPNVNDQITGGNIQFSNGSSITIGVLNNNGTATDFTFAAKTITSLQLNITSVSASTSNVGLAEIQVFGTGSSQPIANAGPAQTVGVNSPVQLDGSGSSGALTYQWTQTRGTSVTLSSSTAVQPTFTTPSSAGTLTFQLVVSNGQTTSSASPVTITVKSASADLALSATATASSQNTSTSQTANKAIDGVVAGYPGDYTKEWATVGGGAGSWLKLTWSSAETIRRIVLYDRPNLDDQITGGNIQFSDGSSITIDALNNNGTATGFALTAAKTITNIQLNITSVSASTLNIGLAEIQVYAS
jgi:hypothetical protein